MTTSERDAWIMGYKLYEEFAPALRQAAIQDDAGATARRLFDALQTKVKAFYDASDANGRVLSLAAYGVLASVYTDARKRAKTATDANGR